MLRERRAIENLLARYAELIDAGDVDGYAAMFARGRIRTDRNPDGYVGLDGVRDMVRKFVTLYDGRPSTKHVVTNVHVEFEDEVVATARSSFTVYQFRPELPLQVVIAGRYVDRLGRDADGWYFLERRITADLVGDLRFHVPGLMPSAG
jgi:3-phenylpropionate/cinnamic acid dioxygenase small subunit